MSSIFFSYRGTNHEIVLRSDLAPNAVAALRASMPARIDIHCAKIAGKHIFWHAPFLTDVEKPADIMTLPPGTFLYWPERQFLELIYGELQAETAAVSVLGQLAGDIGWLLDLGKDLIQRHGHEIFWAHLHAGPNTLDSSPASPETSDPDIGFLIDARLRAWQEMPEEIAALLARRGVMLPYGPLAMAEGEFRKLHELLWRLRGPASPFSTKQRGEVAAFLTESILTRTEGFCGLHVSGRVLQDAATLLRRREDLVDNAIEELILYTGRMAAWLDLFIPWNDANIALLTAQQKS